VGGGWGVPVPPRRDVLILPVTGEACLVLACDVAGGVGSKPGDAVSAPPAVVARFTARVALLEILACGARPLALADGLAVEPEPTGREALAGIRSELADAGWPDLPIVGSSEKNLPTVATAVCVTAVGLADAKDLRLGRARPGDALVVVGRPKVGAEVRLGDPEIVDIPTALALLAHPAVHGLIPAGSGGILPECRVLAAEARCGLTLDDPSSPLLRRSAGPATCLVAAVDGTAVASLAESVQPPLWRVGAIASGPVTA
jgi:hypothetical protein